MKHDVTSQRISNCAYINDSDEFMLVTLSVISKWDAHLNIHSGVHVDRNYIKGFVNISFIVAPNSEYKIESHASIVRWYERFEDPSINTNQPLMNNYNSGSVFLH